VIDETPASRATSWIVTFCEKPRRFLGFLSLIADLRVHRYGTFRADYAGRTGQRPPESAKPKTRRRGVRVLWVAYPTLNLKNADGAAAKVF
jgi:hypothetical protein